VTARPASGKSPDAFRTIGEVAESLDLPTHVLRFWESRFPQIRPVKGAGSRRYYRPADVALITVLRHLLHEEGLSIRAVQQMLRDQGVKQVAAMAATIPSEVRQAAEVVDPVPAAPSPAVASVPIAPPAPLRPSGEGKVVTLPRRRPAPPPVDAAQLLLPGFEDAQPSVPARTAANTDPVKPDIGVLYARLLALRERLARAG
jgi:DNA-binding transcriptional MerR regulator